MSLIIWLRKITHFYHNKHIILLHLYNDLLHHALLLSTIDRIIINFFVMWRKNVWITQAFLNWPQPKKVVTIWVWVISLTGYKYFYNLAKCVYLFWTKANRDRGRQSQVHMISQTWKALLNQCSLEGCTNASLSYSLPGYNSTFYSHIGCPVNLSFLIMRFYQTVIIQKIS